MKRLFLQIFAWLAILLGVGLMLQPTVSRYLTEQKSTKTVQKFVQAAEAAAPAAPETSAAEPARAYPELYDAFLAYNQQLFAQGQSGLKDPFAYETPAFDLTGYGLPDDVIAALWIPRLDLELPVYLGANAANMARGGALLGQTSMPLGGENTNTVIAAHRGYYGAEMLRNVQQIQIGDKITLTTVHSADSAVRSGFPDKWHLRSGTRPWYKSLPYPTALPVHGLPPVSYSVYRTDTEHRSLPFQLPE
jgi:sortase A